MAPTRPATFIFLALVACSSHGRPTEAEELPFPPAKETRTPVLTQPKQPGYTLNEIAYLRDSTSFHKIPVTACVVSDDSSEVLITRRQTTKDSADILILEQYANSRMPDDATRKGPVELTDRRQLSLNYRANGVDLTAREEVNHNSSLYRASFIALTDSSFNQQSYVLKRYPELNTIMHPIRSAAKNTDYKKMSRLIVKESTTRRTDLGESPEPQQLYYVRNTMPGAKGPGFH